jgi:hypothetical protein
MSGSVVGILLSAAPGATTCGHSLDPAGHRNHTAGVEITHDSLPCPCSRGLRPTTGFAAQATSAQPRPDDPRARHLSVIDDDTIRVRPLETTRRRRYTVRLIGIDTLEVYGGVECGGRTASATQAAGHRQKGAAPHRPTQDTFDRYDRLLAYAKLRGGPDAALAPLRVGWASGGGVIPSLGQPQERQPGCGSRPWRLASR